ncbi:MAG: hypothetical protein GXO40_05045 [Epsilonproteobacteria bacterium]|nr:hypothetical protein [Campylobacterota bacterium]
MMQPNYIEEDEIDLRELAQTIWKYKGFVVVFTLLITLGSVFYAISKPNEYKVYTLLSPEGSSKSSSLGSIGALASLAGINIGGGNTGGGVPADVAFGTLLQDYNFMKSFISNRGFYNIPTRQLVADYHFAFDYDGLYKLMHSSTHTKRDFYSFYKNFVSGFDISTDKKSGLLSISYTHPSRQFAYDVLNAFLEDATKYLINKNLQDINSQIAKYQKELATTNNIKLKAELAKLIGSLIKQKVFINTSKYYKVKIIIAPYIPDVHDKVKPKRSLIVIVAFISALIVSIFLVFFIEFLRSGNNGNTRD